MNEDLKMLLGTDAERTDMETAVMAQQRNYALEAAMHRLLHDLRQFMRAYPRTADAEMPDHKMVWVDLPDRGAARVILDAIKANPVLWADALPSEVCIVPRAALETLTKEPYHADYIVSMGESMVANRAAQHRDVNDR
jgi:hypothetical protein